MKQVVLYNALHFFSLQTWIIYLCWKQHPQATSQKRRTETVKAFPLHLSQTERKNGKDSATVSPGEVETWKKSSAEL